MSDAAHRACIVPVRFASVVALYTSAIAPPASSASPPITPARFLSEFRTLMTGNAIVWAV